MIVIEGRAYYRGRLQSAAIGIEDGIITQIKRTLRGDERYDFGEALLLPGGVDVHVHFRDPGLTHKEDFETGTESAAVGGVTTILDMPNTVPPATTPAALMEKREMVSKRANVDFGLYGGIMRSRDVARLEAHCHAFKVYMAESFGRLAPPLDEMPQILATLRRVNRRLSVHAEDASLFRSLAERDLRDHSLARPDLAEEKAIRDLASWSKGSRLHIAHLSSKRGLEAASRTGFTTEVTPMHLLLDVKAPLGSHAKINPPLRQPADRSALWAAFARGLIDVLASDHAPHELEEKEEFTTAPPGAPNVETMYPMMMALVRRGRLQLEVLVRCLCQRPAELFGLRGKGSIEVGKDADIVVFDPRKMVTIQSEDLHYKCGWTPFEGWKAIFPEATFLRGILVARDRELEESRAGECIPIHEADT